MRVKQLWAVMPLPSKLKFAYSRVTLNLPTTIFFILALLQCISENSLHIWLFTQHRYANQLLEPIALNTALVTFPLAVLRGNDLLMCHDIPKFVGGPDECVKAQIAPSGSSQVPSAHYPLGASGQLKNVTLVNTVTHAKVNVTQRCVDVLPWVYQSLRATDRDDLTYALYHLWIFGVSFTAIVNESIPHLVAALVMGALCAIGSVFRIFGTSGFRDNFQRIVVNGSCDGYDIIGDSYFQSRHTVEVVIAALNGVAFIASAGLSWHLIKTYGQRSFERVHKRRDMSRLYIAILTMSSCIQVAMFYMVAAIILFMDQLMLGPLRGLADYKSLYMSSEAILLALVIPWMFLGWTAGRKESKARGIMFLLCTVLFLAAWATKFISLVFRLLMVTWPSFAITSLIPLVLIFVILVLALYSWFHIDLGLAEYLIAEEPPHPADRVRWSLAVTSELEKGRSPLSEEGSKEPRVTWVHLPPPVIVKPQSTMKKAVRRPSTSSVSSNSSDSSQRSNRTISSLASSVFAKSRASLPPDPYSLSQSGLMPALMAPPGLPVVKSSNRASATLGSSDFERIPSPPPALNRSFPALLEAAASDSVIPLDVPTRSQPVFFSIRPSQKNRF